jgi:hypothetical protein
LLRLLPHGRLRRGRSQRQRAIPRHRDRSALFLVADSSQGGAIESVADFTYYCRQRAAQGFNCIQLDLICTGYVGNPDGSNYTTLATGTYQTNDYVTVSATPDRTLALAYFPQGRHNALTLACQLSPLR